MQKKIIALAVAGLVSGAAFAQSNVTMYGVVDAYYAYGSGDNADSQHSINSGGLSGSRLGFKGTEDLGNGLKAMFVLEYGLTVDDNTGVGSGAVARQQLLGLTGGFGTVVVGRAQTAGYDFGCSTGPVAGASALDAYSKLGAATLLHCGQSGRANNAFAYVSPSFGGFTVAYNHGRVTETANTTVTGDDAYANLLTAKYANGPIAANLTWAQIQMENTAASDDVTEWGINGSYDFGMFKLYAAYQDQDVDNTPASTGNKWTLGGSVKVGGAGDVILQYGQSSMDVADSDSDGWTLAYTHALSKRTTAYAGYSYISNDNAVARSASSGVSNLAPSNGGSSDLFAVGIRHTF